MAKDCKKKNGGRDARYTRRNIEKGLTRVQIWIPNDKRERLLKIAEEMRDEYLKDGG